MVLYTKRYHCFLRYSYISPTAYIYKQTNFNQYFILLNEKLFEILEIMNELVNGELYFLMIIVWDERIQTENN